jgi:uncharacterized membrane protein YhaH (DUF805 family)
MNWQTLLLSPEGRMRQSDFWICVLILLAAWIVSPLLHLLAPIVWLLLVYMWICVCAKRLHDFGKSAWLILIPIVAGALAVGMGWMFGGLSAFGALWTMATGDSGSASWAAIFAGLGIMLAWFAVAAAVKFIFLLWVGLSPGDAGDNRFGPPPGPASAPTPTA